MKKGKAIVWKMPEGDTCIVAFISDEDREISKFRIYKKDIEVYFYNIKEEYIFEKGITAYYNKETKRFDTDVWKEKRLLSAFSGMDFQYSYKFC